MLGRALVEAMTFNAVRYRAYFEDARQHADRAVDPTEKKAWLLMAERWLRLLPLAERPTLKVGASPPNRGMERLIRN